jgi:hypothetical protein
VATDNFQGMCGPGTAQRRTLGEMAAGLAPELNQPPASLRLHAAATTHHESAEFLQESLGGELLVLEKALSAEELKDILRCSKAG